MSARAQAALVPGETMISVAGLSFAYGERTILKDLSVEFSRGGMVGLIGPNGAGKTTFLRLLMRMIDPVAGEVRLGGRPIASYSRRQIAQLITLVPQDTQIEYPFSVEELVMMGRYPHLARFQPPSPEDVEVAKQAMRQTQVEGFADRALNTLSGGERQRVLAARSIAQQTPIILLDEATANLDLSHQLEIMDLAHRLGEEGRLVIAAIHDLAMASRFCDRLLLVADGGLMADGPPAQVLTPENLKRYFAIDAIVEPSRHLSRGLSITPLQPRSQAVGG